MFFNADPKWLEEMAKREEECGGECLVGRRQEASSHDTPRRRDYKTSLSCSSIGSLPDEEDQDLEECPVCGEKTLFCYQCLS